MMIQIMRLRVLMAACLVAAFCGLSAAQEGLDEETRRELLEALSKERITLSVEDTDIATILTLMSQAGRVSIVAGPEVGGSVSINLFDVPFFEALDSILGVGGFTRFQRGNIIFVTSESSRNLLPLSISDVRIETFRIKYADPQEIVSAVTEFISPAGKVILSQGKNIVVRDAPLYLAQIARIIAKLDVAPDPVRVFEINHAAPEDVLNAITPFLSKTGLAVIGQGRQLLVQESPDYFKTIREIIESLDIAPRQVLISSKIMTVRHDDTLDIGVELSSTFRAAGGDETSTFSQGFATDLAPGLVLDDLRGFFAVITRDHEQLLVNALQDKARVEVIAAPQLLVLDGEEARIQVGDQLGFRGGRTTTETSTTETVEFLDVGTLLEVVPHISNDGLIRMEVRPEVSSGSIGIDGQPTKRTTEVSTTMLVRDNETIVIAGLLDVRKERARTQVPFLGNIPILGVLFGRRTWIDVKTELVILITPQIVGPDTVPVMQAKIDFVEGIRAHIEEPRFRGWRKAKARRTQENRGPQEEAAPAPSQDRRLLRRGVR